MNKSLVLGFFDGVHKAHRAVISSAFNYSDNVCVITFKESPAEYFGKPVKYILSRENSIAKIKQLGVKEVIEQDFKNIAKMSAKEYLEYLIKTYSPISISTGFNHTFGYNKTGNCDFLKQNKEKYGYQYECIQPIKENNEVISSSLIKSCLKSGNIEKADSLLESNFILEGIVVHGAKIGRTIGFPTANIIYPERIVQIPFGVYAAKILIEDFGNNQYSAIMNWGMKPTFNNTLEPIAEVHILNFNKELYGKKIKVEVIKQIRGEIKFANIEELKMQIKKDIEICLKL